MLQEKLNTQIQIDAKEQNGLRSEIESLEKQLQQKDIDLIGCEKELNLQKNQLESDKRKFSSEKEIMIKKLINLKPNRTMTSSRKRELPVCTSCTFS